MFIIILNYIKPLAEVDRFISEHRLFLAHYFNSGQLLVSGPKQPRDGGIILAVAQDKTEIEAMVASDPFYREGIAEYNIIEFSPAMAQAPFAGFVPCVAAGQDGQGTSLSHRLAASIELFSIVNFC